MALIPNIREAEEGALAYPSMINDNFREIVNYVVQSVNEMSAATTTFQETVNIRLNNSLPTGIIQAYTGSVAPEGWLHCDGRELNRDDYSNLFEVIGTIYGEGNGVTTFNLPDTRDKTLWGIGETTQIGDVLDPAIPNITGGFNGNQLHDGSPVISGAFVSGGMTGKKTPGSGGDSSQKGFTFNASRCSTVYKDDCNTVQPPAVAIMYIIKT